MLRRLFLVSVLGFFSFGGFSSGAVALAAPAGGGAPAVKKPVAKPAAASKPGAAASKPDAAASSAAPARPASAGEKAVSELMGAWRWGMSVDEVTAALGKHLAEQKAPELAKMTDVYAQMQVRKQMKADVEAVHKSLIPFEGQRTGWDVSIIEGEFQHRNGESMMLYRESELATGREQQRFFFFKDGKLWKQFIAFNMEPYRGKTFNDFRDAMESRYGKGTPLYKKTADGKDRLTSVSWQHGGTTLRAIDLLQFYSNFCLVFADSGIEKQMDALRAERTPKPGLPKVIVSGGKTDTKVLDPNADVVDRLVGQPGKGEVPGKPEPDPVPEAPAAPEPARP